MEIDYTGYLSVCKSAVQSDDEFALFRANSNYAGTVETMASHEWGIPYVKLFKKRHPELWSFMEVFTSGDKLCSAIVFDYDGIVASPVTFRYVKVLADLLDCFGSLDGLDIVEIGSGYGGQCKIIQDYCNVNTYTLIDLKYPLLLAEKWLTVNGVTNFILRDSINVDVISYDLLISNYAFTEFKRDDQERYVKDILDHSKHGYIACNFFNGTKDGIPRMNDLLGRTKGVKILAEIPKTANGNFIYTW